MKNTSKAFINLSYCIFQHLQDIIKSNIVSVEYYLMDLSYSLYFLLTSVNKCEY